MGHQEQHGRGAAERRRAVPLFPLGDSLPESRFETLKGIGNFLQNTEHPQGFRAESANSWAVFGMRLAAERRRTVKVVPYRESCRRAVKVIPHGENVAVERQKLFRAVGAGRLLTHKMRLCMAQRRTITWMMVKVWLFETKGVSPARTQPGWFMRSPEPSVGVHAWSPCKYLRTSH